MIAIALILSSLTGCQSFLSRGLERSEKQYGVTEIDPAALYSEEAGFQHPLIRWGMSLSEIQTENLSSVSALLGASEDGDVSYEMSGMYLSIEGRADDSTVILTSPEGECLLASVVFKTGDKEAQQSITLPNLFSQFKETLQGIYGEPTEANDSTSTVESTKVKYVTYLWRRTSSNGRTTELQWSAAYLSGATEPTYLTLGFALIPETAE